MTAHTPHVPRADPDTAADPWTGHEVCLCGLVILPDDPRHTPPDVPAQALARQRVDPHDE
jgi:hypothetical protein